MIESFRELLNDEVLVAFGGNVEGKKLGTHNCGAFARKASDLYNDWKNITKTATPAETPNRNEKDVSEWLTSDLRNASLDQPCLYIIRGILACKGPNANNIIIMGMQAVREREAVLPAETKEILQEAADWQEVSQAYEKINKGHFYDVIDAAHLGQVANKLTSLTDPSAYYQKTTVCAKITGMYQKVLTAFTEKNNAMEAGAFKALMKNTSHQLQRRTSGSLMSAVGFAKTTTSASPVN